MQICHTCSDESFYALFQLTPFEKFVDQLVDKSKNFTMSTDNVDFRCCKTCYSDISMDVIPVGNKEYMDEAFAILFQIGESATIKKSCININKFEDVYSIISKRNIEDIVGTDIIKSAIRDYLTLIGNNILRIDKRIECIASMVYYNCIFHKRPKTMEELSEKMGITKGGLSKGCNKMKCLSITHFHNVDDIKTKIFETSEMFNQTLNHLTQVIEDIYFTKVYEGINSNSDIAKYEENVKKHQRIIIKTYNAFKVLGYMKNMKIQEEIQICALVINNILQEYQNPPDSGKIKKKIKDVYINIQVNEYYPNIKNMIINMN